VAEEDALVPEAWLRDLAGRPAEGGPSGAEWAAGARRLVADLLREWGLDVTGGSRTGLNAVVLPVQRDGEPLVLKVGWPHDDARDEALALRHWGGRGAVRLVAADPGRGALLLERLDPARDLRDVDADTACEVIGGLLARLHVPAPPRVRRLPDWWGPRLARLGRRTDLPRRLVSRVTGLAADLASTESAVLLHTDLHYGNVLAGDREPWLAIDPKPLAGHPGWEVQPLLRNRIEELGTGAALRWSVRHRLEVVCDAAGVDADEARWWSIVATGVQCLWAAEDDDAEALTRQVAILKALDD
jgi:streptomycin 6-kinase